MAAREGSIIRITADGQQLYLPLSKSMSKMVPEAKRTFMVFSSGLALMVNIDGGKDNKTVSELVNTKIKGDAEFFCIDEDYLRALTDETELPEHASVVSIGTTTLLEYKKAFHIASTIIKSGMNVSGRFMWRDFQEDKRYFVALDALANCKLLTKHDSVKDNFQSTGRVVKGGNTDFFNKDGSPAPPPLPQLPQVLVFANPEDAEKIKLTNLTEIINRAVAEAKKEKEEEKEEAKESMSASGPEESASAASAHLERFDLPMKMEHGFMRADDYQSGSGSGSGPGSSPLSRVDSNPAPIYKAREDSPPDYDEAMKDKD